MRGRLLPRKLVRVAVPKTLSAMWGLKRGAGSFCTILLTALELGWVPASQGSAIMILILAFVVPLEMIAGIFGFLARDGGAATGLTLLAAA